MRVLPAGLLSVIRRGWIPAASVSLDRWGQREGEGQNVVWASPMAHHSWWPMGDEGGGLLTCLAWWALSGWHGCMQHHSTLNQMAKHDPILCPLTSLHHDTPGITAWPAFPTTSLWQQQAMHYGDQCHIHPIFISPWKRVTGRSPKTVIQSLPTCPDTTLKKKRTYLVSVSQEHKCTVHCC